MSFHKLRYHIITSTKRRKPTIGSELEPHLFSAIRRKIDSLGGYTYIVNGARDHAHIVASIPPTIAVSDFVGRVKSHSSRAARRRGFDFEWGKSFAVFTVSAFEFDRLVDYVRKQKLHHARGTTRTALEHLPDGESR